MCSGGSTRALPRVGSPIRKSPDQRLFSNSPRLIAAVHVLLRLLAPRHPPRALRILTIEHTYMPLCSFQGTSLPRPLGLGGCPAEASTSTPATASGGVPHNSCACRCTRSRADTKLRRV